MEACFSQLTLDVIGKAVFNYDFDALTKSSPVIQVLQHLAYNCRPIANYLYYRHNMRGLHCLNSHCIVT